MIGENMIKIGKGIILSENAKGLLNLHQKDRNCVIFVDEDFIEDILIALNSNSERESFLKTSGKIIKNIDKTFDTIFGKAKYLLLYPWLINPIVSATASLLLIEAYLIKSILKKKGKIKTLNRFRSIETIHKTFGGVVVLPNKARDELKNLDFKFNPASLSSSLYIANPVEDKIYYSIETYHQDLLEHKFWAVVDLLRELGAKKIRVGHIKGYRLDEKIRLDGEVQMSQFTSSIGIEAETEKNKKLSKEKEIMWESEYENELKPNIESIKKIPWIKEDKTLEKIYKQRIEKGLKRINFQYKFKSGEKYFFKFDSTFYGQLKGLGIKMGGDFTKTIEEILQTEWEIHAEF